MTGIGVPHGLCRLISQSRTRYVTVGLALSCDASHSTIFRPPSSADVPEKRPELTRISPSVWAAYASSIGASSGVPGAATTRRIGSPNLRANSKSRSSWAGTAMIAPVPYSIST